MKWTVWLGDNICVKDRHCYTWTDTKHNNACEKYDPSISSKKFYSNSICSHFIFQISQTWGVVIYNFLLPTCCTSLYKGSSSHISIHFPQTHPLRHFLPFATADGGWKSAKTSEFEKSTCESLTWLRMVTDFLRWWIMDKPSSIGGRATSIGILRWYCWSWCRKFKTFWPR